MADNKSLRARQGCTMCQIKHIKCDADQTPCSNCTRSAHICVRSTKSIFRNNKNPSVNTKPRTGYSFASDQTWIPIKRKLTFIDEPCEPSQGEERSSPEGTQPAEQILSRQRSPKKRLKEKHIHGLSKTEGFDSSRTQAISGSEGECIDLFNVTDLRPKATSERVNSPLAPHRLPSITAKPADEYLSQRNANDNGNYIHRLNLSPTNVFEEPPSLVTFSPSGFNTTTINHSADDANHQGTEEQEILVQLSPSNSTFLSPSIPMTKQEALLFRHYLENLAPWFDTCDTHQHFRLEVPIRAATSTTLLYAIFALSSRHLAITSDYDDFACDRYHQDCLASLIPTLSDPNAVMNDSLLAAIVLLRTLEELSVPLVGVDYEKHLLGTQAFLNAADPAFHPSGLRTAAFRTGLRQDVWVALLNHRPAQISPQHNTIDRVFSPADDGVWASRIVLICAEALQWCFGEDDRTKARYYDICNRYLQWLSLRPSSWEPFLYEAPDPSKGEVFPHIWHTQDCMVIGNHHHHLTSMLLASYNPNIPRIGLRQKAALQSIDKELCGHVTEMCGLALSNRKVVPAMMTASVGVAMFGDRFSDLREQRALLAVLEITEKEHGWPTSGAQVALKETWDWNADQSPPA